MNEHKRLMHRDAARSRRVDTRSLSAVSAVGACWGQAAPWNVGEGQLPPVSVAATTEERGSAVLNLEARQRAEWGGGIRKVADASCGRNPTPSRFLWCCWSSKVAIRPSIALPYQPKSTRGPKFRNTCLDNRIKRPFPDIPRSHLGG